MRRTNKKTTQETKKMTQYKVAVFRPDAKAVEFQKYTTKKSIDDQLYATIGCKEPEVRRLSPTLTAYSDERPFMSINKCPGVPAEGLLGVVVVVRTNKGAVPQDMTQTDLDALKDPEW